MKVMKRLQIATAVTSLFAMAGVANAAILDSNGALLAAEVIQPTAIGPGIGNLSNVRAPGFTYRYEGGVSVQASSIQYFSISTTISGVGDYSFTNATDPLVPQFNVNPVQTARSISANLSGAGTTGRRIGVIGTAPSTSVSSSSIPNGNATDAAGNTNAAFGIVLYNIQRGDRIIGSPLFNADANSTKSVTYFFAIVNNTTAPVSLSGLTLTFNTPKVAEAALPSANYVVNSIPDDVSSDRGYGSLFNLVPLIATATGDLTCAPDVDQFVSLQVYSGEGVNPQIGPEPNNTSVGGANSTFKRNYLSAKRAIDVILAKGDNRQIQVTNSFQTNVGSSPVNGIGGTGGGRYNFKPTGIVTTPVYGGLGAGGSVNLGTGYIQPDATVAGRNVADLGRGVQPTTTSDGNDRAARLATLAFTPRNSALDRLLDVDAYAYRAEQGPAPFPQTSPDPSTAARADGDFTLETGGNTNVFGGVDVPLTGGAPALSLTFQSKADYRGFAGGVQPAGGAPGMGTAQLFLVRATGAVVANGGCGVALGDIPAANRIQAVSGAGGNFVQTASAGGIGTYVWNISGPALQAASGNNSLLGNWHVCYYVSGATEIPNTFFRNATATLFKADASEQTNVSCPSTMAFIEGGVKVDVRHYQARTNPDDWASYVRVVNNSETDTANVEAQYIWDDGKYGNWGTLVPALAPRASVTLSSTQIEALLTTAPTSLAATAINTAIPVNTKLRLRIAADTSTIRVQNYFYNKNTGLLSEVSAAQGADFVNVDASNRDHIDQDAQTGIVK